MQAIDIVEALGIDPADAAPEHWRHVHNRLFVDEKPRPSAVRARSPSGGFGAGTS
jgi:hypothetical protein